MNKIETAFGALPRTIEELRDPAGRSRAVYAWGIPEAGGDGYRGLPGTRHACPGPGDDRRRILSCQGTAAERLIDPQYTPCTRRRAGWSLGHGVSVSAEGE